MITGITGFFDGIVITGLNTALGVTGIPDNNLYTPGNNGSSPADNFQLSAAGVSFDFDSNPDTANIFDLNAVFPGSGLYGAGDTMDDADFGTFTATLVPAAAPEPSQVISMLPLAGMVGAGLLLRFRRRK